MVFPVILLNIIDACSHYYGSQNAVSDLRVNIYEPFFAYADSVQPDYITQGISHPPISSGPSLTLYQSQRVFYSLYGSCSYSVVVNIPEQKASIKGPLLFNLGPATMSAPRKQTTGNF